MNKTKICVFLCGLMIFCQIQFVFANGSGEKSEKNTTNQSQPVKVPKYTDEQRQFLEIDAIEKLIAEKPVEAMWQAKLSYEANPSKEEYSSLYTKTKNAVIEAFNKACTDSKWVQAMSYFESLESCGVKNAAEAGWSYDKLLQKAMPGSEYTAKTQQTAPKMASMVRGTVTVWVDLGLKIENGTGYANRVLGSGFFIDSRGYLVTNHHVIENMVDPKYEGYARLYITLADDPDERIPAKVVAYDKDLDLALLRTPVPPPHVFPLGTSEDLEIGDKIYAIGSPIGLERTITSGIVSNPERKLLSTATVMQIDAAINSGNSGGPVLAENGSVQAIVFAGILQYEGLNFGIPVEYLKTILPRLYAGGKIEHSWIGAYGRNYRDNAFLPYGVEIFYVMPGSPAAKSGLKAGDIVKSIGGKKFTTIEQLQNVLLYKQPSSIITVEYERNGEQKTAAVYTMVRPENPGYEIYQRDSVANYFLPIFGMQLLLTKDSLHKKEYVVTKVLPNTGADDAGFSENDKIEFSRIRVSDDKDAILTEVYAKKRKNGYVDIFISLANSLDSPFYF